MLSYKTKHQRPSGASFETSKLQGEGRPGPYTSTHDFERRLWNAAPTIHLANIATMIRSGAEEITMYAILLADTVNVSELLFI